MHNRLRLLRAGTALLYFGPLLAGLIGQGWGMVPVFVAIFLLWSYILRPQLWPRSRADLMKSEALVALAALVATQILLVIVLFALGRGMGGVMGIEPGLPPLLPAALSFLSVPLTRMVWNPAIMAAHSGFDPIAHDWIAPKPGTPELAPVMLAQVMALPNDVPEEVLQQHLSAIAEHLDPQVIRQSLGDAVAAGAASRAGIKALIVHATDPAVTPLLSGSAYPAQAFAAAGRDSEFMVLFANRCALALKDEPMMLTDCPPADAVMRASQAMDAPAADALQRLAGLMSQNTGSV